MTAEAVTCQLVVHDNTGQLHLFTENKTEIEAKKRDNFKRGIKKSGRNRLLNLFRDKLDGVYCDII